MHAEIRENFGVQYNVVYCQQQKSVRKKAQKYIGLLVREMIFLGRMLKLLPFLIFKCDLIHMGNLYLTNDFFLKWKC